MIFRKPVLRDPFISNSFLISVILPLSISSPFKGEVRRGMGCFKAEITHPHPNPPLEGEGVLGVAED